MASFNNEINDKDISGHTKTKRNGAGGPPVFKITKHDKYDNEYWDEKEELSSQSLSDKHRRNGRNIVFSREIKFL